MHLLETYLRNLSEIHNSGAGVKETSYYPVLAALLNEAGKSLKPKEVRFVAALPKTRSAKIVRAVIRRVHLGQPAGDLSSVENPDTVDAIERST